MTAAESPGVSWYFNTAGVDVREEYRWLPWEPQGDPVAAESVLQAQLGGMPLYQLTSDRTPSIVLGRIADGSFVFYANRLVPAGAPEHGDYQNRPISASVLGVSTPSADPRSLITAAAAAFGGDLARRLPLRWTDGSPAIDPAAGQWPLERPGAEPVSRGPGLHQSFLLPLGHRQQVADDLALLITDQLRTVPSGRVLVLHTDVLDADQLRELRPWRAVSSGVEEKEQVTVRQDRKSGPWQIPVPAQLALAIVIGFLALAGFAAWYFS